MNRFTCGIAALLLTAPAFAADPLPSWNDTGAKKAIVQFVQTVTNKDSPDFVPREKRIATFDNDGTLWAEQPWKTREPFASLLKGDLKGVAAGGEKGLAQLVAATHAGMATDEFEESVNGWIATAKHPNTGKPFTAMAYQPMLEQPAAGPSST